MKKLAVLVSGTGSILEAMISEKLPITLVVADRHCRGLEIASKAKISTVLLPRVFGERFDREKYTEETINILKKSGIGLVAMAGYMTVFHKVMFEPKNFHNKVLNIHPALLPAFKGDHAVRDALVAGVKVTGTTIHYATEEMDNGPIVAQEEVAVLPGDTVESLHERIKTVERQLYPKAVKKLLGK